LTELVDDPELTAKLDATIARHGPKWMRLSEPKLFERIDMWVARFDPAGTRLPSQRNEDRYVEIRPQIPGWPESGRSCTLATAPPWITSLTRWPKQSARRILEPNSSAGRTRWARWLLG
jgi:hypothetical protein